MKSNRPLTRKRGRDDPHQMAQHVIALLRAKTWEDARRLIEREPRLLDEGTDALLRRIAESQTEETARRAVQDRRALLRRCRDVGIEAAFAEKTPRTTSRPLPDELRAILSELDQLTSSIPDWIRRVELCRRATALVDRTHDSGAWALLQYNLAASLMEDPRGDRAENIDQAIAAYELALEVMAREAMSVERARAMTNLGLAYSERIHGDPAEDRDRAIALHAQALEIVTREASPAEWAQITYNLGGAYAKRIRGDRVDNLDRAISLWEHALEIITRQAAPIRWAELMYNLGSTYAERIRGDRAENLEAAIRCYAQALEAWTPEATPVEWARTTANLAGVYSNRLRGDRAANLEESLRLYEEGLKVMTPQAMPLERAQTMHNMARVYRNRIRGDRAENLDRAVALYAKALEVRTRSDGAVEWAQMIHNLAIAYAERIRGDRAENLERALTLCQEALEVRTRRAMPLEWAQTMHNLARVSAERSRGDRGQNLDEAIGIYEELLTAEAPASERAQAMNSLAVAYSERIRGDRSENLERALTLCQEALEVRTRQAMPLEWAQTMHNLARVSAERGRGDRAENVAQAIQAYRQSLEVRTLEALPVEHRGTQAALGNLLFAEHRWAEAAAAYRAAFSAGESLYKIASTPEARQAELRQERGLPARLAFALARDGNLPEAVMILERGRTRALAEALALQEVPLEALDPQERAAFGEACARIRALQTEAQPPDDAPARRDFLTISQDLGAARAELEAVIVRIRRRRPDFLSEPTFADVQAAAGTAPLAYLLDTDAGGLALIVRSGSHGVTPLPLPRLTSKELGERLHEYFSAYLRFRASTGERGIEESTKAAWFRALDEMLRWLWDAAIGPLVDALRPATRATLIPTGWLGLLPLHAAWTEDTGTPTGRRYALDDIALRYAPSAKALHAAGRIAARAAPDSLLAVDDPRPVRAAPLPNSSREVQMAVATFPRHRALVLRHGKAAHQKVRRALGSRGVLHFSCHGYANFTEPLDSCLVMANDHPLSLRDILNLHLPGARLAVLSACETAIAGTELPDEALSLPAGLLQAGVAGVIASLWPVADDSTTMLMACFYGSWRAESDTVDPWAALCKAQQWLRDTTNELKTQYFRRLLSSLTARHMREAEAAEALLQAVILSDPLARKFEHPYHWAAFGYVGA